MTLLFVDDGGPPPIRREHRPVIYRNGTRGSPTIWPTEPATLVIDDEEHA
jgi:hypothetical protein